MRNDLSNKAPIGQNSPDSKHTVQQTASFVEWFVGLYEEEWLCRYTDEDDIVSCRSASGRYTACSLETFKTWGWTPRDETAIRRD